MQISDMVEMVEYVFVPIVTYSKNTHYKHWKFSSKTVLFLEKTKNTSF